MQPLLEIRPYQLPEYQAAIGALTYECHDKEESILNELKNCYIYGAIALIKTFEQPLLVAITIRNLKALHKFTVNALDLFQTYSGLIVPNQLANVQTFIQELTVFRDVLTNLLQTDDIALKLSDHKRDLKNMLRLHLNIQQNPICAANTRIIIRKLKDCLVDIRIIRLDKLQNIQRRYFDNPTTHDLKEIRKILNDFEKSIFKEIVIRDYDSYVVQRLMIGQPDQGHLTFRNHLYAYYPSITDFIAQFQPGGLIQKARFEQFLLDFRQHQDANRHGELQ